MTKTKAAPKAAKKPAKPKAAAPAEATPAPPRAPKAAPLAPVHVDNKTRRSDDDALEGGFARIVNGDRAGTVGTFDQVLTYGNDGFPKEVVLLTRDQAERIPVNYSDLRPETSGRR